MARGDELENDLDAIISDKKYMYNKFIINRYRKDELERKADFIFQSTDLEGYLNVDFSDVQTYKRDKLFLPFSCWSKIEFLLCAIFEPLFVTPQTVFTPRHKFNPNLFSVLYIYSNIVDLVAVNDGNFRLLSTVFLKGDSKSTIKRELIENKSQLYKFLHIDVIDEIEIVILTSLGKPAPFIHGPVYVTLDFKNFHHGQ